MIDYHPRRIAIGERLRLAFPMPDDEEAKDERKQLRRLDQKDALK